MNDLSFPPPPGRGGDPAQPSPNDPFQTRKSQSKAERQRLRRLHVRDKRKKPPREPYDLPLKLVGAGVTVMTTLSTVTLLNDHSPEGKFKGVLIGFVAGVTSYAVNTFVIRDGARDGAYGFHGTTLGSIAVILALGGALFTATASGLILKDVAGVMLIERGQVQAKIVASRIESARRVERYVAVVESISADLQRFVTCEQASACISGKSAGRGDVTKALEGTSGRAEQLVEQLKAGKTKGGAALDSINGLLVSYQTTITSNDDVWARWSAAGLTDAKVGQALAEVEESLPISAVHAYAVELESGAVIDGNPAATSRITAILRGHGERLKQVDVGDAARETLPPFPQRPGVSVALSYGLMFLPIIGLCFVTDLAIPLSLFMLRYTGLRRRIEEEFGRYPDDDDPPPPDATPAQPLKAWPESKLVDRRNPE